MGEKIKNIIILSLVFSAAALAILWFNTPQNSGNTTTTVASETVTQEASADQASEDVSDEEDVEQEETVYEAVQEQGGGETEAAPEPVAVEDASQPINAASHINLGMQYYKNEDLQKALWHLQEALKIEPDNSTAQKMMAKVSREAKAEDGFTSKEGSHFIVKYEGGENAVAGHVVALVLEEAYQKVGSDLGFYPEDSITAILYSGEQFKDVTRAPSWAGAIYDGKIRIPVGGVTEKSDLLERVIFHEFTHAVVQRMGGGRAPTWLNEGIAQYEEGYFSQNEDNFKSLASAKNLAPLNYLEGSFMGFNQQQAAIAYAESLSAVKYIIDEYGMGILTRLISSYKENKNSEAAIKDTFQMTFREFQDSWARNLKKRFNS